MPRKATIGHKGYRGIGGDPDRRNVRPDTGARKSAKKVRDLEAVAKQFAPLVLNPRRLAAMTTGDLIAALEALVQVETFYLSRSKDPRPIRKDQPPREGGFTLVLRRWRPGTDPVPILQGWAERLGTDPGTVLRAFSERPGTATATVLRDLAERLGKDPATVLQDMEGFESASE